MKLSMVGCKDLQINVSIMHGEDCDEESIMGARSSGVNLPLTCWTTGTVRFFESIASPMPKSRLDVMPRWTTSLTRLRPVSGCKKHAVSGPPETCMVTGYNDVVGSTVSKRTTLIRAIGSIALASMS